MTSQEIEGNKLIAEFMGIGKTTQEPELYFKPDTESYWITSDELKYHTSWDWLMPVIEKIHGIRLDKFTTVSWEASNNFFCFYKTFDTGEREDIVNVEKESNIKTAFTAVVEFIKLHHFDINGHIPFLMGTSTVYSCVARTPEKAIQKFKAWKQTQKP